MRSYHVADINAGERVRFKDITAASMKYNGNPPRYKGYPQGRVERIPRTETLGYDMNVFTVVATETEVTVRWQDLTVTECSGRDLVPDSTVVDIGDAWPGEVICTNEERKDIPEDERWAFQPAKVGVIQSVQPRDRIASVRWYENPEIRLLDSDLIPPTRTGKLQANTEEISLYDIRVFGLTRHRGDFVMIHPDAIRETEDGEPDTGSSDAEWFGEIVDLGLDGKLTVRLGVASPVRDVRVAPETVSFVYNDDDDALDDATNPFDEVTDFSYDTSDEWEGHMDNMWVEYQEGMGGVLADDADEDEWSTEDEDEENEDHNGKGTSETTPVNEEDAEMHEAPNTDASTATATPQPLAQNSSIRKENDTTTPAHIPETSIDFDADILSPFMILDTSPPSNHHFYFQNPGSSPSFLKRISKEHKILRSSLPQGIFVRTWESHLNLLRVLVIGPADTPYEYAPFVIDLCVDSSYPSSPPLAYFHSWTNGQGPINPNLYEDGKICLSLLGTWHTDEHNESWSSKSTLLQVLISIHSLVLNKDPYYNEAGFDVHRQTPETRLSSALYTERAYFRARAFITHALTNDIQPFEQELKELYLSQRPGAPQLLAKAISSAKEVIARSEKDDGEERDGLKRISRGALVPLKRQVEKLEELTKSN
jgi:ubiquitin-conjugating enzyme E2 O